MTVRVLQGHVLEMLAALPARSVHCVVTSPPFWGLRNYGTPPQVWETGNECACKGEHEWGDPITDKKRGQAAGDTARVGNTQKRVCPPETQQGQFCQRECGCEWGEQIPGSNRGGSGTPTDKNNRGERDARAEPKGAFCRSGCGSWRGELGSEPTVDLFVSNLVTVFEAVKRVMRDDATLWVNLGDSYVSNPSTSEIRRAEQGNGTGAFRIPGQHHVDARAQRPNKATALRQEMGLKQGDLCMAPARFALAMQAAGWRLRSEITLCKTAPMPESIQGVRFERCRVKVGAGAKDALSGAEANAQRGPSGAQGQRGHGGETGQAEWADCPGCRRCEKTDGLVQRWGSGRPTSATERLLIFAKGTGAYFYDVEAVRVPAIYGRREFTGERSSAMWARAQHASPADQRSPEAGTVRGGDPAGGRNLWNYVMWSPEPLAHAHYAAYPRWLPRLAIQAGTSERGVCPACAAPWLRVVDRKVSDVTRKHYAAATSGELPGTHRGTVDRPGGYEFGESTTLGWRQSCRCAPHEPVPATCLDPFSGSGTTLLEANALGRHGIGVELNGAYCDIAERRLGGQPLSLFAWEGQETLGTAAVGAGEEAAG